MLKFCESFEPEGGGDDERGMREKVRGMRTLALIERVIQTLGQRRGALLQMLRGEG